MYNVRLNSDAGNAVQVTSVRQMQRVFLFSIKLTNSSQSEKFFDVQAALRLWQPVPGCGHCGCVAVRAPGPAALPVPRPSGESESMCCFVLLVPTPEEYRVQRAAPGVTASKLSPLLPSLATPGPPLPYRPLQKSRYYYACRDLLLPYRPLQKFRYYYPRFRVGPWICFAS